MTARILSHLQALAVRDAHSYYAITELAKREGLSPDDWYTKYADGLPADLAAEYDALVDSFEMMFRTGGLN